MKLTRHHKNPILKPNPKNKWEADSVLNPCVIFDKGTYHVLYRATAKPKKSKMKGWKEWRISSIGHAISQNGINFKRTNQPIIKPEKSYESLGCEDARITKLGDTFWITYTAVSNQNNQLKVRLALASTKNFKTVKKHGLIGPNPTSTKIFIKAAAIFPEKIDGKYFMIFTYNSDTPDSTIYQIRFTNFKELTNKPQSFWTKFIKTKSNIFFSPSKVAFRGPEVGAPPIKTEKGWLLIYCGESSKKEWAIYSALLDLKNPQKILWRSNGPILKPEKSYEKKGIVNRVTFPSGAVVKNEKLLVYYGAGDKYCCLATTTLNLTLNPLKHIN